MKKQILAPSILALFVASAAHAGATFDTSVGSLYLGGDVEFDYTSETDRDLYSSGRLLVDINGQRSLDNGYFAAFKVNPTFGQNGGTGVDDVWFKFGMSDNWALQAGHFEATDLSPAGQDTFVASSGTAMYRANFARVVSRELLLIQRGRLRGYPSMSPAPQHHHSEGQLLPPMHSPIHFQALPLQAPQRQHPRLLLVLQLPVLLWLILDCSFHLS